MVKNAVKSGAIFKPGSLVKEIVIKNDCVEVKAVSDGINIVFKGKILIGADGANAIGTASNIFQVPVSAAGKVMV